MLSLNILALYTKRSFIWQISIILYFLFQKKFERCPTCPTGGACWTPRWGMLDTVGQAETLKEINIRFHSFWNGYKVLMQN